MIEEVKHRYQTIGRSPLTEITLKQGELLAEKIGLPVYVGMRNWRPFVSQTSEADGGGRNSSRGRDLPGAAEFAHQCRPVPHLAGEMQRSELTFDFVESWHDHPL